MSHKFEDLENLQIDQIQKPEYYPPEMLQFLID
jgi:hypothetical protein